MKERIDIFSLIFEKEKVKCIPNPERVSEKLARLTQDNWGIVHLLKVAEKLKNIALNSAIPIENGVKYDFQNEWIQLAYNEVLKEKSHR